MPYGTVPFNLIILCHMQAIYAMQGNLYATVANNACEK